jgi:hypothetical protein
MKVQNFKYLVVFLFFLYFFIVFEPGFHGPDEPLYFSYTDSIVADGDLNLVNNIDLNNAYFFPSGKIGVSKTYNLPDYHNHGGVLFWAPAYFYGKFSYLILNQLDLRSVKYSIVDAIKCALSFSTVFFAFLTLLLSYFFCRIFFSRWTSFWSILAIFFGTPFFVVSLFETGNANMLASLLSVVLIWICSSMINMKKTDFFLFGLFFSLCIIVKSELAFQAVFILLIFSSLIAVKQIKWSSGGYFLAGVIPGAALRLSNDFIKYGALRVNELGLFNVKNWYFLEQFFSPYRGFFYTSPILFICLLGLVLSFKRQLGKNDPLDKKNLKDRFFVILSSYLLVKLFVLAFRFAWGGGTPGARILCTEFLVFVLLFARAFQVKRYLKLAFIACVVLFVSWNLIMIYEYTAGIDMQYILHPPALSVRMHELVNLLRDLISARDLGLKLGICLPLFCLAIGVIFLLLKNIQQAPAFSWCVKNNRPRKLFMVCLLLTAYLCLGYSFVTILNLSNNQNNVLKLKDAGFFKNAEILSKREFEKIENISSMDEMIKLYQAKGDTRKVEQIKIYKNQLYGETENAR